MNWGLEGYLRLKWAEANRPSAFELENLAKNRAEQDRAAENARIRARLPKVA